MSGASLPENGPINWPQALESHRRWLRTVVWARVGSRDAVDEVMQEVALATVGDRAQAVQPERVAAWLYRVAVRQSLLYRRREGRERKRRWQVALGQPQQVDRTSPLRWLLRDEETQLVQEALQRLPERDSELLMLKYTEDWSCRQLSEHLGVSVTAVENRLQRARQRLRTALLSLDSSEAKS